jgi:hypothetical protein
VNREAAAYWFPRFRRDDDRYEGGGLPRALTIARNDGIQPSPDCRIALLLPWRGAGE